MMHNHVFTHSRWLLVLPMSRHTSPHAQSITSLSEMNAATHCQANSSRSQSPDSHPDKSQHTILRTCSRSVPHRLMFLTDPPHASTPTHIVAYIQTSHVVSFYTCSCGGIVVVLQDMMQQPKKFMWWYQLSPRCSILSNHYITFRHTHFSVKLHSNFDFNPFKM